MVISEVFNYLNNVFTPVISTSWVKTGSPIFFARGPHNLLHDSLRTGHLT